MNFLKRHSRWLVLASLIVFVLLSFCVFSLLSAPKVNAEAALTAEDITAECNIEYGAENSVIESDKNIAGIYIEWKNIPGEWSIIVSSAGEDDVSKKCGEDRFFHEYVTVEGTKAVLDISNLSDRIQSLRVFGDGKLPADVQVWEKTCETADLMLLSTHSDDEHLFFAGILPYYAGELGMDVQVVYMVDHALNSSSRPHELLNGLWSVGVRNYPVIGEVPDLYSESLADAYSVFADEGYSKEYFVDFVTENIRRFKPLVIVGHDIEGEYGHGAHRLYTDALISALSVCNDEAYHSASAAEYGVWEVPKVYLHLYGENEIVMNWDNIILESFGGRSAFKVSVEEGFSKHESQHYTWFSKWCGYNNVWGIQTAEDIESLNSSYTSYLKDGGLSPRRFGLYQSSVGEDILKNDFFEHISAEEFRGDVEESATKTPDISTSVPEDETLLPEETVAPASTSSGENSLEKNEPQLELGKVLTAVLSVVALIAVSTLVWVYFKKNS